MKITQTNYKKKLENEKYTHLSSDIADMRLISKFIKVFRF